MIQLTVALGPRSRAAIMFYILFLSFPSIDGYGNFSSLYWPPRLVASHPAKLIYNLYLIHDAAVKFLLVTHIEVNALVLKIYDHFYIVKVIPHESPRSHAIA